MWGLEWSGDRVDPSGAITLIRAHVPARATELGRVTLTLASTRVSASRLCERTFPHTRGGHGACTMERMRALVAGRVRLVASMLCLLGAVVGCGDDDPAASGPGAGPGASSGAGAAAASSAGAGGTGASGGSGAGASGGTGGSGNGAPSGWPGPDNTGVPPGTQLEPYDGPCTIQEDGVVIDSKIVDCDLRLLAADIVIRKSKVNGTIYNDENLDFSFRLEDSEVDAGAAQQPAVWHTNMTIVRSNIHGGQTSVSCWQNCTVEDSWLHGQQITPGISQHLGAFLSNGGAGVVLTHNTIVCDSPGDGQDGGCSGDINLFGDFEPISDVTVINNFLGANTAISYCIYGGEASSKPFPHADHVRFHDNVVERGDNGKCGGYGPVTSFDIEGEGNEWVNNTWDDGSPLDPAN